jgi:aminopeptidase C
MNVSVYVRTSVVYMYTYMYVCVCVFCTHNRRSAKEVQDLQRAAMVDVYAMLCMHLGTPPTHFDWQYRNKEKEFVREGVMTPMQFAERYASGTLDGMVSVVHDPRTSSPYDRTFTVQYLGNVVGGTPVTYLNIHMGELKALTQKQLESGKVVWCVTQLVSREKSKLVLLFSLSLSLSLLLTLPLLSKYLRAHSFSGALLFLLCDCS